MLIHEHVFTCQVERQKSTATIQQESEGEEQRTGTSNESEMFPSSPSTVFTASRNHTEGLREIAAKLRGRGGGGAVGAWLLFSDTERQ